MTALQSHPLRTNSLAAGFIGASGDGIAQQIECRYGDATSNWDVVRTGQMFAFCCAWLGVPQVMWFRTLARRFPEGTPSRLRKKLAVHLGLMAPTTNALFFAYREALRESHDDTSWAARYARRMQHEFPPTIAYSLCFWTPAQAINFTFVPLPLRPLYLNGMMVVWTTYLSIAGHRRY